MVGRVLWDEEDMLVVVVASLQLDETSAFVHYNMAPHILTEVLLVVRVVTYPKQQLSLRQEQHLAENLLQRVVYRVQGRSSLLFPILIPS